MNATSWLAFSPRDTVFVRDGRSFDAATDTTGVSVRPSPTTIAGATGALFDANPDEVRGPVLARQAGGEWDAYFPVPADLVRTAGSRRARAYRLVLTEADGLTDLDSVFIADSERNPHWLTPPPDAGRSEPLIGLIPAGRLAAYLAGDLLPASGAPLSELRLEADPFRLERRVGLAREGRRARSGFLYQVTHLRAEDGWAYLAQCVFAAGEAKVPRPGPVKFGGRGRFADVEAAALDWPAPPDRTQLPDGPAGRRVLVYLATPALWPGGWLIPEPPGAHLVAAVCGKPLPTATLTPGPAWKSTRVLRWAVPAGSVYLLEFGDAAEASRWAADHHGTAYGAAQSEPGDLEYMRTAGFGVVLTGVWND